ncbi:rhamnogalacturonan acetylesterase [Dysgonomonas sp. BGC7]|uniref:rhamnogalacturonan acetylesterase n=1 Tax=Dysgonomonas sp. BGC7 TaxID=1658008 RepID=UPI000A47CEA8|nr:rhamnogalacturonan acetylesterase [Dysgonomonas sp. BGC7]MBD8387372.1 rhamnogalacturonan acetylesterase [Dysgonomonas sp. BGC7]
MNKMKFVVFLCLISCACLLSAQVRILSIGDSTMADYDEAKNSEEKEKRGWVQMLPMFFTEDVRIDNAAKNGRSSKSFYFEFWENNLCNTLKTGDYVFIQFGHNDEKNDGKDTGEEDKKERGTAPWGQYVKYLSKYITESREKGAIPILITPVVRRMFDEEGKTLTERGKHNLVQYAEEKNDSILNYALAMKSVAQNMDVPLIDMTSLTQKLVEEYGPYKSKEIIYCVEDNTHLKAMGGIVFSRLFVKQLLQQGILTQYIQFPKTPYIAPHQLDLGLQLVTIPSVKVLSIMGSELPIEQRFKLKVNSPFSLSLSPNDGYKDELNIVSKTGDFYYPVYVHFIPDKADAYNQNLRLTINNDRHNNIHLKGKGVAADGNKAIDVKIQSHYFFDKDSDIETKRDLIVNSELIGLEPVTSTEKEPFLLETLQQGKNNVNLKGEIDMNTARYVEISLTAKLYDVYLNYISFDLKSYNGDKMQFTVLGSVNDNFSKPDSYTVMENMSDKALKTYSFHTMVKLSKGKTYRLRIYPWDRAGMYNKFHLDNILIKGLGK